MGGEREETIKSEKGREGGEGGRPRRRTGASAAGSMIQEGASSPPPVETTRRDEVGQPLPTASPARYLLAALEEAGLGSPPGETGSPPRLGGQAVRCHESNGQIHFHADADGLKAAVPVAEMWSAWRRLQHLDRFTFLDEDNGSLLTIVTRLDADPTGGDRVHLVINLAPCRPTYSTAFEQLDKVVGR